ncbi:MAG: threonine synthase [Flavobacteriaceae bacterium]|nr:threonine synthase [Flavobacteriaceae bacterium]MCY4268471.1 threonine synthase [Flavobacteriaceae bacterium]MCY4299582.1 threonine synthase [Flavobacteriaceae bacterium]
MKYYNLGNRKQKVDFSTAVLQGIAPDKSLYFPEFIPKLRNDFICNIEKLSDDEIAYQVISPFIGDSIPPKELKEIIKSTLTFDFPLVPIEQNIFSLELFHGPTLAFKDVGARFMAHTLNYLTPLVGEKYMTVLVATSGDTGGAVANAFLEFSYIRTIIVFPKGKVSEIQEAQITSTANKDHIEAFELDGTFDTCQDFVKRAFVDEEINDFLTLTSANSINIARLLPQMFYYFLAYKQLKNKSIPIVCSVPSGNFGNLCAGLFAKEMGLPIDHFIASTNRNNTVVNYLSDGTYHPIVPSIKTISNAMDVGQPSNFVRIQELYGVNINNDEGLESLKKILSGYWFDDGQTKQSIEELYQKRQYIADPHGAIGYLGLKSFLNKQENSNKYQGIFLETAHPIKFRDDVEQIIQKKIPMPNSLKETLEDDLPRTLLWSYPQFKSYLMI